MAKWTKHKVWLEGKNDIKWHNEYKEIDNVKHSRQSNLSETMSNNMKLTLMTKTTNDNKKPSYSDKLETKANKK